MFITNPENINLAESKLFAQCLGNVAQNLILENDKLKTKEKKILIESIQNPKKVSSHQLLSSMTGLPMTLSEAFMIDTIKYELLESYDGYCQILGKENVDVFIESTTMGDLSYRATKAIGKIAKVTARATGLTRSPGQRLVAPFVTMLRTVGKKSGAQVLVAKYGAASVGGGIILSGAVLAALMSWAAARTYKKYFSKAARSCKGKKGP